MAERKTGEKDHGQPGVVRRDFLKTVVGVTLLGGSSTLIRVASAEDVPPEPDDLDEPTQWQEGDPEPVEMTIPAVEPEQTSSEAPPSQPMDDERPPQPDPEHAWVIGYWWWSNGAYVWVPGYWAPPPHPNHVYVAGYWTAQGDTWVYVRGGWAKPNTTVIVAQPQPRPVLTAMVITAPIRIRRRHRRWRHHHHKRARHKAHHRARHKKPGGPGKGPGGPGKGPGGPGGPQQPGGPRRR